jgi:hypothetical protein
MSFSVPRLGPPMTLDNMRELGTSPPLGSNVDEANSEKADAHRQPEVQHFASHRCPLERVR